MQFASFAVSQQTNLELLRRFVFLFVSTVRKLVDADFLLSNFIHNLQQNSRHISFQMSCDGRYINHPNSALMSNNCVQNTFQAETEIRCRHLAFCLRSDRHKKFWF